MNKITMVDYGLGNVYSTTKAFEHCGAIVNLTSNPQEIREAEKLVLPGVGAFRRGMEELNTRGLVDVIRDFADRRKPILGICLGMQILFDLGREFGECEGLGLISGTIDRISGEDSNGSILRVPHVGWNALIPNSQERSFDSFSIDPWYGTLFEGLPTDTAYAYFVHSYVARPRDNRNVLAYFNYGNQQLVASVQHGSIWGCQFHPERSGELGVRIIRNFLSI